MEISHHSLDPKEIQTALSNSLAPPLRQPWANPGPGQASPGENPFSKKPAKVFLKKTRTQHAYLPTVQRSNLRFQPPLTWLAEIRHCAVLGPDISVISPDGALLSDVSLAWEDDILNYPIFRSPVWKKPFFVKGEAALLAVTGGNNYFHWLFESLPRFELLS